MYKRATHKLPNLRELYKNNKVDFLLIDKDINSSLRTIRDSLEENFKKTVLPNATGIYYKYPNNKFVRFFEELVNDCRKFEVGLLIISNEKEREEQKMPIFSEFADIVLEYSDRGKYKVIRKF